MPCPSWQGRRGRQRAVGGEPLPGRVGRGWRRGRQVRPGAPRGGWLGRLVRAAVAVPSGRRTESVCGSALHPPMPTDDWEVGRHEAPRGRSLLMQGCKPCIPPPADGAGHGQGRGGGGGGPHRGLLAAGEPSRRAADVPRVGGVRQGWAALRLEGAKEAAAACASTRCLATCRPPAGRLQPEPPEDPAGAAAAAGKEGRARLDARPVQQTAIEPGAHSHGHRARGSLAPRPALPCSPPLLKQERITNTEHLVNLDLDAKRNALVGCVQRGAPELGLQGWRAGLWAAPGPGRQARRAGGRLHRGAKGAGQRRWRWLAGRTRLAPASPCPPSPCSWR